MARTRKITAGVDVAADISAATMTNADIKENNIKILEDSDEIEVKSLIPNVSYENKNTGDRYEWYSIGDTEIMTFGELKNMRRIAKGYFNELWLRPMDERVIKHFNLERVYKNYDSLMDEVSYTAENINDTCKLISDSPNGIKWTVLGRIKSLIDENKITNIKVLRVLEKKLNVDLISLL